MASHAAAAASDVAAASTHLASSTSFRGLAENRPAGRNFLAQRLAPLAPLLESLAQRVSDTILQAQSECWWAAMAFYSALARLSSVDPELEVALKPAVEFFARRSRSEPAAEA
jgi:hypothetical protein